VPDGTRTFRRVDRHGQHGSAAAHCLLVRPDQFQTAAHKTSDPVADAHVRQIGRIALGLKLAIHHPMEFQGHVDPAARERQIGHALIDAGFPRGHTQRLAGPTVECNMGQGGQENAFADLGDLAVALRRGRIEFVCIGHLAPFLAALDSR